MSDWRSDLEAERHGVPSRPPPTDTGPTRQYELYARRRVLRDSCDDADIHRFADFRESTGLDEEAAGQEGGAA